MSIDYQVSEDGLKIETHPKGKLDIKDTLVYFESLKTDGNIKQGAIEIVYFKHVTDFEISYQESERITRSYQKPKALQKIKATIFICESTIAYGIGRMLQTMHEIANPDQQVLVLRSEKDLEKFILSDAQTIL